MLIRLSLLVTTLGLVGCSAPEPPADVQCNDPVGVSNADALEDALARAGAGDCVVAEEGSYNGCFSVGPGVTLVSEKGGRASVSCTGGDAAVRLADGAVLWGVDLSGSDAVGILSSGANALMHDVTVVEADTAAVVATCSGSACRADGAGVLLEEVELTRSDWGLWAVGARVEMRSGRVAQNDSKSVVGGFGYGILASGGAQLTLDRTLVSNNGNAGVLVDGAGGTTLDATGVEIRENTRGIWIQRIDATAAQPAVRIRDDSQITANTLVGVGVVGSTGIVVSDSQITGNLNATVVVNQTQAVDIGDGLGIFGSGELRVERCTLEANERTQLVIDDGRAGIALYNNSISDLTTTDSGAVIQNTSGAVTVDDPLGHLKQIPVPLIVDPPVLPVPSELL